MASWTELRHDTILYVKQSDSSRTLCDYPAGYVDPRVEFWDRMLEMCSRFITVLKSMTLPENPNGKSHTYYCGRHVIERNAQFLEQFHSIVETLRDIAKKENSQEELGEEELKFFRETVSKRETYGSGAGVGNIRTSQFQCGVKF
eukprot:TRINITY_DN2808_c0_g1_i1.p1 TRINITY_DN2808_c0_g1~~TRINITY_DN2808_c0_g1_i1.p1  ORF type:complete len:145 (-),score=18.20 TRINITY_DN2808_c0_g1_i1:67-501(-)